MTGNTKLTEGKHLAWNSLLNVATAIATSLLAMAFVPVILRRFGTEFYGILSITWMVLANFSWLDFGFSRASARFVAQELANDELERAALWTWTAVASQGCLGVAGALLVYFLAPFITDHIHVDQANRALVILTLRLFGCSIPIDFANRSLTGVLQAAQRFSWVNAISLLSTVCTYTAYGIGIARAGDFKTVVYALFVVRIVGLLATFWAAARVLPGLTTLSCLRGATRTYRSRAIALIRYGWWVASAAIVAPLLAQFDQWMISVIIGVSLLPYYTVPSSLLWRLSFLPGSLATTLFPAFSAMEARTDWSQIESYFVRAHRYLLTVVVPILFVTYIWGGELLRLWVGAPFAAHAELQLKLLVFGFLIGLLAPLSGTLLEAIGRPDILVKLYLAELPFNVVVVWFLTKHMGVAGAALSYTVRTAVETILLWIIVYRVVPFPVAGFLKNGLLRPAALVSMLIVAGAFMHDPSVKSVANIVESLAILALYSALAYRFVFDAKDRAFTIEFVLQKQQSLVNKLFARPVPAAEEVVSSR